MNDLPRGSIGVLVAFPIVLRGMSVAALVLELFGTNRACYGCEVNLVLPFELAV